MIELIVAIARFSQFAAAVTLFGSPLFFVYALADVAGGSLAWGRGLVRLSSGLICAAAAVSLLAQTAVMAGDPKMAFDAEALDTVLTGTAFGSAIVARISLAAIVFLLSYWLRPGQGLWLVAVGVGGLILASFAWTGHGAAEDGAAGVIHAVSDIVHLIAAGVWLGALTALAVLLWNSRERAGGIAPDALHKALERFSGIGSLVVAVLLASGLANSWFLVGPTHLGGLVTSPYGWLLLAKIGLFGAMLLLAAANRYRLTPALGLALKTQTSHAAASRQLRRSVFGETALGVGVLALVSVLGMLAPVSAQM